MLILAFSSLALLFFSSIFLIYMTLKRNSLNLANFLPIIFSVTVFCFFIFWLDLDLSFEQDLILYVAVLTLIVGGIFSLDERSN